MSKEQNPESIYEGEIRYVNQYMRAPSNTFQRESVVTTYQTVANVTATKADRPTKILWSNRVLVLLVLIGISVLVSLVTTLVLLAQVLNIESTLRQDRGSNSSSYSNIGHSIVGDVDSQAIGALSCLDLKKKGNNKDAIYELDTRVEGRRIEVFCDMETDGGGWTLVASIHEDDINEKCGPKDRWVSDISSGVIGAVLNTNWENKLTFGRADKCTVDDYKNEAYFELNARDIMIWHVPVGSNVSNMKSRSYFRYRTTDQFLLGQGGNLYGLFNDRYPLTRIKRPVFELGRKRTERVLNMLHDRRDMLKGKIPNWQVYKFNGQSDEYVISDTALYSNNYGNRIYFRSRHRRNQLYYDKQTQYTDEHFVVATKRAEPFMMVTAISNDGEYTSDYFRTEIYSYLRSTPYENTLLENNLAFRNFHLQYSAVQYFRSSYPTICEFHFIVFNQREWGSSPATSFNRTYQFTSSYSTWYYSYFTAEGSPKNFVMGYLLLTRTAGRKISRTHTNAVANVILNSFVTLDDLFNENVFRDGLSVAVTFDEGNPSKMLNTIPPIFRPHVDVGYMQFRAFNETGYASAFCPGVRLKSFKPEYICVGGVSGDVYGKYGTCGDFSGWAGREGDMMQPYTPSGYAHSSADIGSTILIFYR